MSHSLSLRITAKAYQTSTVTTNCRPSPAFALQEGRSLDYFVDWNQWTKRKRPTCWLDRADATF
jgi:hypothetical protein